MHAQPCKVALEFYSFMYGFYSFCSEDSVNSDEVALAIFFAADENTDVYLSQRLRTLDQA